MNIQKNRWYDRYPHLSAVLEKLKEVEPSLAKSLLREVKEMIISYDSDLINNTILKYPLEINRRWYDKDPLTWMTINALKFADDTLRNRVAGFLADSLHSKKNQHG